MLPHNSTFNSIEVFSLQQKTSSSHVLYREAKKWHAKGSTANQKVASQIKLEYLRNLRGARADIKRVRQKKKVQVSSSAEYDYSDWYRRDVSKSKKK